MDGFGAIAEHTHSTGAPTDFRGDPNRHRFGHEITPIGQAKEWYYALKINNVPVEMIIFDGENHNLSRTGTPVNLVERLQQILNWFERYT